MKIANTGPVQAGAIAKRNAKRTEAKGDFSAELASDLPPNPVGAAAAIESLETLLSVQEVGDPAAERRQARKRGDALLDRLNDVRMGLLQGAIPRHQLDNLISHLQTKREHYADPRLNEVLDEIELRASVEVAKLEILERRKASP